MSSTEVKTETESQISTSTTQSPLFSFGLWLRKLLFWTTFVAAIVMLTSKQTENGRATKYSHYPAFKYLVVALWIVFAHSFLSALRVALAKGSTDSYMHLIYSDLVSLTILASATGTAGAIGYIGLKGNSHDGWSKTCDIYDKFCRHLAASLALSLFGCVLLITLIKISAMAIRR